MENNIYNPSRFKLGWFNAWIGFIWFFLFIHSFKFFFAYESFLKRSFTPVLVSQVNIEIDRDSSEMSIVTEKGTFYHYNKSNFMLIAEFIKNNKQLEIWFDKENKNTADFKANGKFLLKRSRLGIILYLIGLIFSGGMVVLSTILVIKTKGWGTYDLMKKHNKSFFKYLFDELDPWHKGYKRNRY